jgi:toxin FitB
MTDGKVNWLVDTNVISETRRSKRSPEAVGWLASLAVENVFTSTVNLAELVYGAKSAESISKRLDIEEWIEQIVRPLFGSRVLEVNENVLVRWRILKRMADKNQTPTPSADLLIAAVALENRINVATRDVLPYVACRVPTLNPWTGERFNGA